MPLNTVQLLTLTGGIISYKTLYTTDIKKSHTKLSMTFFVLDTGLFILGE